MRFLVSVMAVVGGPQPNEPAPLASYLIGGVAMVVVVGVSTLIWNYWERFPEVLRWMLLLPTLGLSMMAVGIIGLIILTFQGEDGFWVELTQAATMSSVWFAMVFALAPRAKERVGWVFYVLTMSFMGLLLLLMVAKGVGIAGLLPMLPVPDWAHWSRRDTIELGQTVIWIVFGTVSFRHQLHRSRREAT